MSPLAMKIALHYYTTMTDYNDGDFSNRTVYMTLRRMHEGGLLELDGGPKDRVYSLTDMAMEYLDALEAVPLPTIEAVSAIGDWASPPGDFGSLTLSNFVADRIRALSTRYSVNKK